HAGSTRNLLLAILGLSSGPHDDNREHQHRRSCIASTAVGTAISPGTSKILDSAMWGHCPT
ncbi:hypothetical protein, partial [Petrachloros mirabilis]